MTEMERTSTNIVEERQKRIGLWAAAIFAVLGLAFFIYDVYTVFILQAGRFDLSDQVLMPVAAIMFLVAAASLLLIQRNRFTIGAGLLFYFFVLVPPIIAVLVLQGMVAIGILYIVLLASIMIFGVLPAASRRWATVAAVLATLLCLVIDYWNPGFRVITEMGNFATTVIIIAGLLVSALLIRQAIVGNIRTKLIVSFVLVAVISVASVVFFVDRTSRASLTNTIGSNLSGIANTEAIQVGQTLVGELDKLNALAVNKAVQNRAEAATAANGLSPEEIKTLDQQWTAADAAGNNADPLVARALNDPLSAELLKYQAKFPENVEIFLTDLKGVSVATTDRTSDYLQSDEAWWQAAFSDGQYIAQPEFDASSKTLAINMAVAVRASGSNQIVGVLRTTVNINSLASVLSTGVIGQTGRTDIFLPDGQAIKLAPNTTGAPELTVEASNLDVKTLALSTAKYLTISLDNNPSLLSLAGVSVPADNANAQLIQNLGWTAGTHQAESEALSPVTQQTQGNLILGLVIAALAALAAFILAQVLAGPIVRLNAAAEKVAAGDLTVQAKVETNDETGTLAATFNKMVAQLGGLVGNLEQRVSAATRDLTLASEVGRNVAQVHDLDTLLKNAVDLIQDRFKLYYTQVYLLDPTGRQLVLRAGTGAVGQQLLGRHHSLAVDLASLNGTASVEKHPVIVENTGTSTIHRPNPLLPETRSEMVVPLLVGDRVVGTLDMQSSQAGALNKDNLVAFETLAGQLAIAVENATLLAETESARATVEAQSRRLVRTGWQDFLNAVEHSERIGYSYDLENMTSFTDPLSSQPEEGALVTTIPVLNEPVGAFKFEGEQAWSEDDTALVDTVAHQLGRQVENLRLLAQTDQYRTEAEQALRRLTRQGWEEQFGAHPGAETGFTYDLNTISPTSAAEMNNSEPGRTHSLEISGEKIGELSIAGTDSSDEEVNELLAMVSEQLSTRVENLRLFEATERGQVELEKRARQLAAVSEISTISSKELDVDKMLHSVVHLTQRLFGLYHAHVFLFNENNSELKIAACGWKQDDIHEGTDGTVVIPITQEQSLVTRAVRNRHAVIVNDVHNEPGWLPNPLLPLTASELAVPLIIGDQVVGVLDVQSERLNAFSEEDANIQTTLASQVAIALQNARSFAQAQKQAERGTMLNVIGQKIRSATSVEAVLQIAARELGHALGAPLTVAQLGMKDKQ